jgi:hypothetical protein
MNTIATAWCEKHKQGEQEGSQYQARLQEWVEAHGPRRNQQ